MKRSRLLAIGLMSGTSMDGIDAALIETDGVKQIKSIAQISSSYTSEFKLLLKSAEEIAKQCQGDRIHIEIKCLAVINQSTELHAQVVRELLNQADLRSDQIDVLGYHGQTLFHQPSKKLSIQIGNAKRLAELTKIRVINQFRQNDLLHGGQGAPLAPIYHQALAVRDNLLPVAVVNCGGIANVTFIESDNDQDILGFDTGPGNALLDRFVRHRTNGNEFMDEDGKYGLQGEVREDLLSRLYQEVCHLNKQNYFSLPPPKSLDVNDLSFPIEFGALSLADGCATLAAFTARTILDSVAFIPSKIDKWILTGGGWNNPVIYRELKNYAQQQFAYPTQILKCSEVGWNNAALEAELFAYLAVRCIKDLPISFPKTTGVFKPLVGGEIYKF
jgi:anhydro-N-acetylmuramic acid kinase